MRAKRYEEAIQELQMAQSDSRRKGVCLLVLGECFQQIKQYRLAKSHYESAIQEIPDRDIEHKKKALYLAGRLAMYLKDVEMAEKHLTALAAMDFTYKDISRLLDKLAKLRENLGFDERQEPPEKPKSDQTDEEGAPTSEVVRHVNETYCPGPPKHFFRHAQYQERCETTETKPCPPRSQSRREAVHPHRMQKSDRSRSGGRCRPGRSRIRTAAKCVDQAAAKKVIHRNAAARTKSRLAAKLRKLKGK